MGRKCGWVDPKTLRMGEDVAPMDLGERVAGKWQIPLLVVSLAALGISIATYRSELSRIPFDEVREEMSRMVESGRYTAPRSRPAAEGGK